VDVQRAVALSGARVVRALAVHYATLEL
jgi:hypothetical protein